MYDWANSAFAVVVLAAVLPTYFVEVAGTSLPNPSAASSTYALVVAGSLALVALLAPVLGALSDLVRAKKILLSVFVTVGVAGTSLLFLVGTGDWVAAAIFFVIGRFGFGMANVFYDALLPHTAIEEDLDRVSTRGYAMGYLGGGLVLAAAVVLILFLPDDNLGVRLSFLLVGAWWAISSIPILRQLPEPPAAAARLGRTRSVVRLALTRIATTIRNFRRYRQLGRFLAAFLLYDTAIGTVIALAVVYGADLGFGVLELVAALLLVQFAGIPFTLLFGALARKDARRRGTVLGFLTVIAIALPLVGLAAAYTAGGDLVGREGPPFATTSGFLGEGEYTATTAAGVATAGEFTTLAKAELPRGARTDYLATPVPGATLDIPFNGERIKVKHSEAADHGRWAVAIDGVELLDDGEPLIIDGYRPTVRFEVPQVFEADERGEHVLTLTVLPESNPDSLGRVMAIGGFEILPPQRVASMPLILGSLGAITLIALLVGLAISEPMSRRADRLETRGAILFSLAVYTGIAVWGYFLDTIIEFWYLALAVAIVQGGSQALSRSLYAAMAPASQSGEFFGFFTAVARLTAIVGPLLFAGAVTVLGSSRPAVASLAVLFIAGALLLLRVDVGEGKQVAREHDATALSYPRHVAGGLVNYGRPQSDSRTSAPL
jgi:UMF1 family MFS transporter